VPPGTTADSALPADVISNGVDHWFQVDVQQGVTTFIDPLVAVGYEFATAQGDPNFASVLLPAIGDNLFDISDCAGTPLGTAKAGEAKASS